MSCAPRRVCRSIHGVRSDFTESCRAAVQRSLLPSCLIVVELAAGVDPTASAWPLTASTTSPISWSSRCWLLVTLTVCSSARIGVAMASGRHIARRMRVFVLAALMLVPLVSSGHHHAATTSPASCAVCIAAHHAPAVVVPAPAAFALALSPVAAQAPTFEAPPRRVHSPNTGRAPPRRASLFSFS